MVGLYNALLKAEKRIVSAGGVGILTVYAGFLDAITKQTVGGHVKHLPGGDAFCV
jgi:dihydroxyacetone kinase-like predicted kinase